MTAFLPTIGKMLGLGNILGLKMTQLLIRVYSNHYWKQRLRRIRVLLRINDLQIFPIFVKDFLNLK